MNLINNILCKISPCRKCTNEICCFMCVHKHWSKFRSKEILEELKQRKLEDENKEGHRNN